VVPVYGRA